MKTQEENRITTKMFLGCVLTSELKLHLQNSPSWKQAKIESHHEKSNQLVETHFQGKDYIGLNIEQQQLSLEQLKRMDSDIRQKLSYFCPSLQFENTNIILFPQILVS